MTPQPAPLKLFEGFGVELEYMIVNRETLNVLPVTDEVLRAVAGSYESEVEQGALSWSNELVLHVIELKTNGPANNLKGLAKKFGAHAAKINELVRPLGGRLMPTGMHPWMDPHRETKLWPHDYNPVYETFNRIFDCRGHGWANLQSIHLNLPFGDDEEFGRLHAAIRLLLPIIPALAASTPIVDGRVNGRMDNRLEAYRTNSAKIPSVSGAVIPEAVFTKKDYEREILERIYRDLAPHDPEGVLRYEWANARGAIARFDRNTIEVRVLDMQECPQADLAVVAAIAESLRELTQERWVSTARQQKMEVAPLAEILLATIKDGERAQIANRNYLEMFGLGGGAMSAGDIWRHLIASIRPQLSVKGERWLESLEMILERGPLARRIVRALGPNPSSKRIKDLYAQLCDCLDRGELFEA